jgi:ubiquinone/menaquinone biosynthesis C-methylase UbiE
MNERDSFSLQDIEFHRRTAESYDDEVTRLYGVYHRYSLEPFLDSVAAEHPGGRALDLGCGTGVVTLALASRGFDTVGVDHSPEMLELARRKLEEAGRSGHARVAEGDVRKLPFSDGEFVCVTCQGLLHHLEELDACLGELERVLVPGGRFYISEPCREQTVVRRALENVWRVLRRRPEPRSDAVVTVEAPIASEKLRAALDRRGLEYEAEYLTDLPPLRRRLPDGLYLSVTRILSYPWRRRRGDLVFVRGRKPPSSHAAQ